MSKKVYGCIKCGRFYSTTGSRGLCSVCKGKTGMGMQTIKYESNTLLPDEMSKKFDKAITDVCNVRYEQDKIHLVIMNLRGDIIRWLAANSVREKQ